MRSLGNVFILGDSYSTFEGYIPQGYSPYYGDWDEKRNETGVENVNQTWWYPMMDETGSKLLRNCSYSGSTICFTGYDGADYTRISFITRLENCIRDGFFEKNKIDTLILFGATNDSWADAPLGELMYEGHKKEDLYKVFPAIGYLFNLIAEKLRDIRVLCIINDPIKEEVKEALRKSSQKYGFESVSLKNLDLWSDHPTIKGMKSIKDQIISYLESAKN